MLSDHFPRSVPADQRAAQDRATAAADQALSVGALVVDRSTDRVGVYMYPTGGRLLLRPVGWGRVWVADPGTVELAGPREHLRAEAARQNARSRGELL